MNDDLKCIFQSTEERVKVLTSQNVSLNSPNLLSRAKQLGTTDCPYHNEPIQNRSSFNKEQIKYINKINQILLQTIIGRGEESLNIPTLQEYTYNKMHELKITDQINISNIATNYLLLFFSTLLSEKPETVHSLNFTLQFGGKVGLSTLLSDLVGSIKQNIIYVGSSLNFPKEIVDIYFKPNAFFETFPIEEGETGISFCPFKNSVREFVYHFAKAFNNFINDHPNYLTCITIVPDLELDLELKKLLMQK